MSTRRIPGGMLPYGQRRVIHSNPRTGQVRLDVGDVESIEETESNARDD
jgi:hypothetical protein